MQITKLSNGNVALKKQLANNEIENIKLGDNNARIFYNKFENVPGIIVSAGPSLEKSLDGLQKINNNVLVFSVGRSLSALFKNKIKPHMFCIIDASDLTYEQIKEYEEEDIPFVYLSTASKLTVSSYKGPRFITYNSPDEIDNIETGGSVATAVFDLLIKFGCNPIIFIGQDLAYTGNVTHHLEAKYENISIEKNSLKNMRKVKSVSGNYLNTDLGLLSFKKWFENKIKLNKRIFINSSFGAEIYGATHMSIEEVSEKYIHSDLNINEKISNILSNLYKC